LGALLLAGPGCGLLPACGPFFPNSFLDARGSDGAVLAAPSAAFTGELARMNLEPSKFQAVTNGAAPADQAAEAELRDLAEALKKADAPAPDAARICASHRAEREKLKTYLDGMEASEASRPMEWDEKTTNYARGKPAVPPPEFPKIASTRGLPDEFADYFEGAVAWDNSALTNKESAREAWREVLLLPAPERHFKSTWAAFMLGKSLQKTDAARAIAYFKRVRDLCGHGFADSLGLAAASIGLEAQTELQQGRIAEAMALYLEQFATGDPSAYESLRLTASAAVNKNDAAGLAALAANQKVQHVITAYLISRNRSGNSPEEGDAPKRWLTAVEASGAQDVAAAEEFALAAYQAGDWQAAQRWIDRAPGRPANQWLQAKLLLRAGKVDQAAVCLTKVTALFPIQPPATNAPTQFKDDLTVEGFNDHAFLEPIPASEQILGELGVVHLARREYVEALDALWRSGFGEDAGYVANRVLTVDELKEYVDRNWPPGTGEGLRELLAQRLARLHHGGEARLYYPEALQPEADGLAQALAKGADTSLPAADRAAALFAAAKITEDKGAELLGDDFGGGEYWGTNIESGTLFARTNATVLRPTEDELRRASQSAPDPDVRYFYRFQAAALAWQAALLMPDNSDETARVLCEAGSWIKYLNPQKADVFYKALVRRCRRTALGAEADRKRWFPILDEAGNLAPSQ